MKNISVVQGGCVVLIVTVVFLLVECQAEVCPDHKMSCRKGQTCCDDKQGGYGCCPYDNATCCADGLHCCPENTQCELSAGRCKRSSDVIKQAMLIPLATFSAPGLEFNDGNELELGSMQFNGNETDTTADNRNTQCPDQKSSCPESYTCCADPEGSFACCPYPSATCCDDKIHCCPHGRRCTNSACV